jgi:conjugal transfer/entry exclusion protein
MYKVTKLVNKVKSLEKELATLEKVFNAYNNYSYDETSVTVQISCLADSYVKGGISNAHPTIQSAIIIGVSERMDNIKGELYECSAKLDAVEELLTVR